MGEESQEAFDGLDDGVKTTVGFGGKTLTREERLRLDDEFYLLLHCKVVTDGRSKKKGDDGKLLYKAGVSTTILAELDQRTAAQIAADHG